jgi:hypothetical protein
VAKAAHVDWAILDKIFDLARIPLLDSQEEELSTSEIIAANVHLQDALLALRQAGEIFSEARRRWVQKMKK